MNRRKDIADSPLKMEPYEKIFLYQRIVRAKLFIDRCFAETIDLNNISDQAYFSKFHFIRLFKSIYGKTPNHYLIQVRIDRAKLLLQKGSPVAATSMQVGFESPTTFAGLFKRFTGQTPSQFQKEQIFIKNEMRNNPMRYVPNCFAETHGWIK